MRKTILLFCILIISSVRIFSKESKIINVGYLNDVSVIRSDQKSIKKEGYNYEYFQKIASITGWKYNYVFGSWPELMEKLDKGQIDIMPSVSKNDARLELYDFTDFSMGTEIYTLFAKTENENFVYGNKKQINGKTVGICKSTVLESLLDKLKEEHNVDFTIKNYNSHADCHIALENNEVDAFIDLDVSVDPTVIPVMEIGSSESYFVTKKGNDEIFTQLNNALSIIHQVDSHYNNKLWIKYYTDIFANTRLIAPELKWIENHPVIKVGCTENAFPYCYKDSENNSKGYMVDLLEYTKSKLELENISFEYYFYSTYQELLKSVNEKKVDVIFPVYINLEAAEANNIAISEKVYSVEMSYVCNDSMSTVHDSVAVNYTGMIPLFMEEYYPSSKLVLYDSKKACLDAVVDDKCPGTVFDTTKIENYLRQREKYRTLQIVNLPYTCDIGFGVINENIELLGILDKGITLIPNDIKTNSITTHILANSKYSVREFLIDYMHVFIAILIGIMLIVLIIIISLDKLRLYMNYDSLTRLLNRRTLDTYLLDAKNRADEKNEPFSILMLDLDDFKRINDIYGHACGDEVLKAVAKSIMHSVSNNDNIFRWGGEEILIVVKAEKNIAARVGERVRHGIQNLVVNYKETEIRVTVTIGVAAYEKNMETKDLFEIADANMYKGKKAGKNVVICE